MGQQQPGPLWVIRSCELRGGRVVASGGLVAVDRIRLSARGDMGRERRSGDLPCIGAEFPAEPERGRVVVGEQFGAVLPGPLLVEPRRRPHVLLYAFGARDMGVRDVLDEGVAEPHLALALERRSDARLHELCSHQPRQDGLDGRPIEAGQLAECAAPRRASDHRRVVQDAARVLGKQVDAGGNHRME